MATTTELAVAFARRVKEELTENQMRLVRQRNDSPHMQGAFCASHDFCDANVVMAEAFEEVRGHPIDLQNEADTKFWGESWMLAKVMFLTEKSWTRHPIETAKTDPVYEHAYEAENDVQFVWISDFEPDDEGPGFFEETAPGSFCATIFNDSEVFNNPADAAKWVVEHLS